MLGLSYPSLYAEELVTKTRAVFRNQPLMVLLVVDEKGELVGNRGSKDIVKQPFEVRF